MKNILSSKKKIYYAQFRSVILYVKQEKRISISPVNDVFEISKQTT